jgi:hypothetical protein
MVKDNENVEPEVVFEGGKGKKRSKTGASKFRREVGEGSGPVISEELFYAVKDKMEDKNKLK